MRTKSILFLAALFQISSAFAQFDSPGTPFGNAFVDNVVQSIDRASASPPASPLQPGKFSAFMTLPAGVTREELPFWVNRTVDATYTFNRTDSKLADGAQTDTHTIAPELYFESKYGFALDFSLSYANAQKVDRTNNRTAVDTYTFTFQPAYTLLKGTIDRPLSLVLGGVVNYARSGTHFAPTVATGNSQADAYSVGGSFLATYKFCTNASATMVATYANQWKDSTFSLKAGNETEMGVLSLSQRADFSLTPSLVLTPTATWKHDVNQVAAPGKMTNYRDWGEFGGSVSYGFNDKVKLRVGYTYLAFRSDYDSHSVLARVELKF
jgi:hypothetical protein